MNNKNYKIIKNLLVIDNNKLKISSDFCNKDEIDSKNLFFQNKITEINNNINIIKTEKGYINKSELLQNIDTIKNDLNIIKNKINEKNN